jgi:thymidine phosphorylase
MSEGFDAVDVIRTKRDRGELSDAQIDWVIGAYTRGAVAEEQMAALAMAVLLNGMTRREIARWTDAMIRSGERMDFSGLQRPTADKHSTGGVGDKITLPLAPLVAACGVAVPQLSGRGLGAHRAGTLDKLESIPGLAGVAVQRRDLAQLRTPGAVICAAGEGSRPADKKLYALRDVTGHRRGDPADRQLDHEQEDRRGHRRARARRQGRHRRLHEVRRRRPGARPHDGRARHRRRRPYGRAAHRHVDARSGLTAGNALEVRESVEVLAGGGPPDVVELTVSAGSRDARGRRR